ncbi:ParB N-terminal domain-containing protein [Aliiroseovarius subalbicans]|uniref:ParB N-terminal domain-containing protein n=1 Tax=Aliiroseovarius subalbicans TaxID=2925840 RepID=UPI001F573F74|nr:ParB N-terminal domain-containing protein [Aliiroseovarius subalbicans]MCI2400820.1 ParB N-terminal domain-containing protein [Aliiroseovarius subalbicans]
MPTLKTEPKALELPATSRWKLIHVSPHELVDYGCAFMPCHSDEQIQTIVETIRNAGFSLPVVTNGEDSIFSGQGRVKAARKLKLSTIPTIPLQYMTEQERRLLSIGLIRLARFGNWLPETLEIDLRSLAELRLNTEFKIDGGFCDARGNMYYPKARRLA